MKKPNIEKHIEKIGNRLATSVAFIGLGVAALIATQDLSLIPLASLLFPIGLDAYSIKSLLNEKKGFKPRQLFSDPFFKKSLKKWVKIYIEDSESLTEKKYKVICLKLWMNHKSIKLGDLVNMGDEFFSNLTDELLKNGETKFPIDLILITQSYSLVKIRGEEVNVQSFLNEDRNNPEKINIAKKVYKEFDGIGMTAKAFLFKNQIADKLLFLQDNNFNNSDYDVIEDYVKNFDKKGYESNFNLLNSSRFFANTEQEEKEIKLIVNNEDSIDNLKILQKYCTKMLGSKFGADMDHLHSMNKQLKTKIDYIELGKSILDKGGDVVSKRRKI